MENRFGNYIKKARKKMGWSLVRACEATGISIAYICLMENGKLINPSAKVLIKLCNVYSFKPSIILNLILADCDERA